MDTLDNMRTFIRVIEAGSFTAAGQSLNTTTSVVSRAVSELERHLHARLLSRTTRKLALTPAGERYLERCRQLLADLDRAEEEAGDAQGYLRGTLRLFSFTSLGQQYVLPAIRGYRVRYPDIKIELTLLQHTPDLYNGSIDVAIVAAAGLPDSDIVSHQLGTTFNILCAAPAYLTRRGMPHVPDDLKHHDCLTLRTPAFRPNEWRLESATDAVDLRVEGTVQLNVAETMVTAVRDGMGVGMLPLYSAIDGLRNGTLVRVLPDYTLQPMNIYVMHASRRFIDAKTRSWVDFLREHLPPAIAEHKRVLAMMASDA